MQIYHVLKMREGKNSSYVNFKDHRFNINRNNEIHIRTNFVEDRRDRNDHSKDYDEVGNRSISVSLFATWVILGAVAAFIGSLLIGHFYYKILAMRVKRLERQRTQSSARSSTRKKKSSAPTNQSGSQLLRKSGYSGLRMELERLTYLGHLPQEGSANSLQSSMYLSFPNVHTPRSGSRAGECSYSLTALEMRELRRQHEAIASIGSPLLEESPADQLQVPPEKRKRKHSLLAVMGHISL